jgi:hypothetical protein
MIKGESFFLVFFFFTSECCILLRIYITASLWRRQSQQSFNTLTPFNFLFYSLHISAPTGHPQMRYTISYYFCFWRTILIQRTRCTYAIWYSIPISFIYLYHLMMVWVVLQAFWPAFPSASWWSSCGQWRLLSFACYYCLSYVSSCYVPSFP